MHSVMQLVEQNQDMINLLFGIVSTTTGVLLGMVRWLRKRLDEEIRFSPASALALGYFNNFLLPVSRSLAGKTPVSLANSPEGTGAPRRVLRIVIPRTAAQATREGIQSFHRGLEQRGMRVVPAQIEDAWRPLAVYALIRPDAPGSSPILFECPSTLGNLVEIVKFHLGDRAGDRARREKLEVREIGNFTRILRQLIEEHQIQDLVELAGDAYEAGLS